MLRPAVERRAVNTVAATPMTGLAAFAIVPPGRASTAQLRAGISQWSNARQVAMTLLDRDVTCNYCEQA
jgi:hypothetical protein